MGSDYDIVYLLAGKRMSDSGCRQTDSRREWDMNLENVDEKHINEREVLRENSKSDLINKKSC